jgi:GH25 family lysozyme M1 (1,4-beta-N-acetylmuramidase)
MPRDPRHKARPIVALLIAAVAAMVALPSVGLAATSTDYIANCPVNLRGSASTSGTAIDVISTGALVTASGTVAGGSWSATCVTDVSGSSWYSITAVGGKSVSSLYGVAVVYAATGLFHLAPPPGSYLEGIDVSHWQGTIDWTKVAASGKKFAVMKATEAQIYADSQYPTWHPAARAVGIRVGAYHFASPSTTANDAVLEADWFVAHAALQPGDLNPALDLEASGGLSVSALQSWVGSWLAEVYAKTGMRPMIYTSPSFWKTYMGDTRAFADAGYTVLWVAHWFVAAPTVPASNWGGRGWTFWQYSDCGSVPGISGCVDLDRYNGLDLTKVTYGANFTLSAPATMTLKQGGSGSVNLTVARTYFSLPVTLSISGLPAGATASLPSAAGGASVTLGVATSKTGTITPVGTYRLTITGTSNGLTRTASISLVVTDGISPAVVPPVSRLFTVSTLGFTTTPVRTSWSAADTGGISAYGLMRQTNGTWANVTTSTPTSTNITQSLAFGTKYRYAVRATDNNANTSFLQYGPTFTPMLTQQTATGVTYTGSWGTASSAYASGGSMKFATSNGASVTYAFTGASVSWVSYRGPTRGSAAIYIDGVYQQTVNLYATTYASKQVVYGFNWSSNGAHKIKIVCLGTAGHPRVDVDAFVRFVQA